MNLQGNETPKPIKRVALDTYNYVGVVVNWRIVLSLIQIALVIREIAMSPVFKSMFLGVKTDPHVSSLGAQMFTFQFSFLLLVSGMGILFDKRWAYMLQGVVFGFGIVFSLSFFMVAFYEDLLLSAILSASIWVAIVLLTSFFFIRHRDYEKLHAELSEKPDN